jgi:hypothetical protein
MRRYLSTEVWRQAARILFTAMQSQGGQAFGKA